MLALKAEGVVWAAHDLPQLFAQHVESETVRKLNLKGQRAYREAKVAACGELLSGHDPSFPEGQGILRFLQ